jgi:hypothetical protein
MSGIYLKYQMKNLTQALNRVIARGPSWLISILLDHEMTLALAARLRVISSVLFSFFHQVRPDSDSGIARDSDDSGLSSALTDMNRSLQWSQPVNHSVVRLRQGGVWCFSWHTQLGWRADEATCVWCVLRSMRLLFSYCKCDSKTPL